MTLPQIYPIMSRKLTNRNFWPANRAAETVPPIVQSDNIEKWIGGAMKASQEFLAMTEKKQTKKNPRRHYYYGNNCSSLYHRFGKVFHFLWKGRWGQPCWCNSVSQANITHHFFDKSSISLTPKKTILDVPSLFIWLILSYSQHRFFFTPVLFYYRFFFYFFEV